MIREYLGIQSLRQPEQATTDTTNYFPINITIFGPGPKSANVNADDFGVSLPLANLAVSVKAVVTFFKLISQSPDVMSLPGKEQISVSS